MSTQSAWKILRDAARLLSARSDAYTTRRLLIAVALVSAGALLMAIVPIALQAAIDTLGDGRNQELAGATLALVLAYVGGMYLARSCSELRILAYGQASQRLQRRLGGGLFEHVMRLPYRVHVESKAGAISQISEQGLRGYEQVLSHLVYTIAPVGVELVVVAIVLLRFDHARYLGIIGASVAAYVFVMRRGAMDIREPAERAFECNVEAHSVFVDSLVNSESIKYFAAERSVVGRHDDALSRTEAAWRVFFWRRTLNGLAVAAIFGVSLGCSLVMAAKDVAAGAMTVGGFVLVNTYVMRVVQPLEMLGFAIRDIAHGLAFLERMLGLLGKQTETNPRFEERDRPSGRGELTFENVGFSYGRGTTVLRDISFTIKPGCTTAVVGVSGSGKSSLIRLLFRLYEPDTGRILLDGMPISEMPLDLVRQSVAVVPQDTILLHDTVSRNIALGRYASDRWEIEEAARIANLHEFILGLPDGYETVVGERGLLLSGGERQRVAIARAALQRPSIFVFDEATSSLDTRTEREILRNLLEVSRRATTLVIAHRLSTIVDADEILVMDRGEIVERGVHEHLLARGGHYAILWRTQQLCGPAGAGAPIDSAASCAIAKNTR